MMRLEIWGDHLIRFVEYNGEWWAVLKVVCGALKLNTWDVSRRLESSMMEKVDVGACDPDSNEVSSRARKTQRMIIVNELGIYEALFASRKLEARKFRVWTAEVLKKLRRNVGLEGYEVMRMTEPDIQDEISMVLDAIYWDEEKQCLMESVTVPGGDVEQVPFE